jgi:RAD51-like protein 1
MELLLKRTCRECAAKPVSALVLLHRTTEDLASIVLPQQQQQQHGNSNNLGDRMRSLPTGLPSLDRQGGGIRVGTVTEVVGRAGAGKTQLALQLIVMAAKYNQGAMYIDTENKLILDRLREMIAQRFQIDDREKQNSTFHDGIHHFANNNSNKEEDYLNGNSCHAQQFSFKQPSDVLKNMTVKQPNSTEELFKVLEQAEEEILHRNQLATFPVRLLILDSIAAPIKRDFGSDAAPQRAAAIFSIAQTLKRYADQLHLAIVVINQVGLDNNQTSSARRYDQVAVRAALGTSWHHCVSTRLLLEHEVDPHRDGGDSSNQVRRLSVVKSNVAAFSTMHFEVKSMGIVEVASPEEESTRHS